jgi:hypothetical protein
MERSGNELVTHRVSEFARVLRSRAGLLSGVGQIAEGQMAIVGDHPDHLSKRLRPAIARSQRFGRPCS